MLCACLIGCFVATKRDDDTDDDAEDFDMWHGNKRRKLWKSTCSRAAVDVSFVANIFVVAHVSDHVLVGTADRCRARTLRLSSALGTSRKRPEICVSDMGGLLMGTNQRFV